MTQKSDNQKICLNSYHAGEPPICVNAKPPSKLRDYEDVLKEEAAKTKPAESTFYTTIRQLGALLTRWGGTDAKPSAPLQTPGTRPASKLQEYRE